MNALQTFGYVADLPYTLGFHRELAPVFLNYVCAISGVEGVHAPRVRYCELGCGRGYGTTLLAASNPDMEFVGVDFNPAHIEEARALAKRADIPNVGFLEMGFAEAARADDALLGGFDIVALHGVYSWVTQEVRADIHEFIRRKLLSGGIAFVSYNAMPGCATVIPTQRLLIEAANRSSGDSIERLNRGLTLLKLLAEKAAAASSGASAAAKIWDKDKHYLVHEFLSAGWAPLFVTDAMAALAEAGLSYVGSAIIADNQLELGVPEALRQAVRDASDVAMRELLKDYATNKQFRRDVYVKGPKPQSRAEQEGQISQLWFARSPEAHPPEKLRVPVGHLAPGKALVSAIWDCMRDRPATGAELLAAACTAGANAQSARVLLDALIHNRLVSPARSPQGDANAARRLNAAIMETSLSADTHRFLASPVTGSAFGTTLPERVLAPLLAHKPQAGDVEIASEVFERLSGAGQHLLHEGRAVTKTDDNVRALARFVGEFREQRLPRWRALNMVA